MKYKLPKIIPNMKDLLRRDQQYREDRVSVVPISGAVGVKPLDRSKARPWRPLPSIKDFVIEISPYDWLPLLFLLKRRYEPKTTFYTWYNDKANAYVDYMFERLSEQVKRGNYMEARATMWILMKSTAYQVVAINHIFKNWHRKLTYKEVMNLAKEVHKLAKYKADDIKFKRLYIPKGDTWRPLGIPSPAWRVYLHMYNNCIVQWRMVSEGNAQHGYLPKRGVITAWQELVKKLKSPNIYEGDYEKFFDNVAHVGIRFILKDFLKLPHTEVQFINRLNESLVELTPNDKIKERERQVMLDKDGNPNPQADQSQDPRIISGHGYLEFVNTGAYKTIWDAEKAVREGKGILKDIDPSFPKKLYLPSTGEPYTKDNGVPQGAPTSCSTATLALRFVEMKCDVVLYADDVIYFPKSSKANAAAELSRPMYGLRINPDKSRWLKKDGTWLVDSFKFLGLRYYPGLDRANAFSEFWQVLVLMLALDLCIGYPICTVWYVLWQIWWINQGPFDRFEADTRNGATLKFTSAHSFLSYLAIAREILLSSRYVQGKFNEYPLNQWLKEQWSAWTNLTWKARLLFGSTRKSASELLKQIKYWEGVLERKSKDPRVTEHELRRLRMVLKDVRENSGVDNPLTGYLVSRMQANTWNLSQKQNFKMRYVAGSWMDKCWPAYAWSHILPLQFVTVFNSSSFACHDLLEDIRDMKNGGRKVRWVTTANWRNQSKRQLELLKTLVMFRQNVG